MSATNTDPERRQDESRIRKTAARHGLRVMKSRQGTYAVADGQFGYGTIVGNLALPEVELVLREILRDDDDKVLPDTLGISAGRTGPKRLGDMTAADLQANMHIHTQVSRYHAHAARWLHERAALANPFAADQ